MSKKVIGVKEISKVTGMSEATVMDAIFNQGMPADKDKDGIWNISRKALDKWLGAVKAKRNIAAKDKEPAGKNKKSEGEEAEKKDRTG